jgi:prepilin-type N-terminal cleavage/methylation domain-containing protein/prepilin-type processing-associated H-X9-DG protein
MYRANRGFTLVELLVVITIIGILVALLIPAVNMIREEGRQTACLNNQMQIGKAMMAYELAKNHLPGVLNLYPEGTTPLIYNWIEALFPYLERADLWQTLCGNNAAQIQAMGTMRWQTAVCPDDPYLVDPTSTNIQALLSFGVNDGFFCDLSKPLAVPPGQTTITPQDYNGNPVTPAILSRLASRVAGAQGTLVHPSTTIMIGEHTGIGSATSTTVYYPQTAGNYPFAAEKWTDVIWTSAHPYLTFHWPTAQTVLSQNATPTGTPWTGILVSNHPGKVVVVFFDGHGEKVVNSTFYPQ